MASLAGFTSSLKNLTWFFQSYLFILLTVCLFVASILLLAILKAKTLRPLYYNFILVAQ
jgi:hypothetical protein